MIWVLMAAGCAGSSGMFSGGGEESAVTPATPTSASGLAIYLKTMNDLVEGDPVTQAEVFADVSQAVDWAPTTTNRLRYALALAVPDHPSSDAISAASLLNELLASTDALLPEERNLATIHLKEVEARLVLNREGQRLKEAADSSMARQNAEANRRLRATAEENRRLRLELKEAQEKLEAITDIERSIQEREDGDSP